MISTIHLISEMAHACTSIIELVPSIMCASERQPDFTDVLELYEDDLPSPQLFVTEQMGWKDYWSKKEPSELPNTELTSPYPYPLPEKH